MKKHIVIVSYTFPPSRQIGGRRWAKFGIEFYRRGHKVTVITSKNQNVNGEFDDAALSKIDIRRLNSHYPKFLEGGALAFFDKIRYHLTTKILKYLTKNNLFDKGVFWRKSMLEELEKIHFNNPIDVLIVTGGPFSLLLHGSQFKNKYPSIKYVTDIRDPWTWGSLYGIPTLSGRQRKHQEFQERLSIEAADMFCYPTQHMGEFLKQKYPEHESKLYLLPHAYDPEKFASMALGGERHGFIYGGTLYDGIEDYIKTIDFVFRNNNGRNIFWDIYSGTNYPLIDLGGVDSRIQKLPLVPEEELFKKITKSSAYLAIYPVTDKDLISTKFFEIIYTQTPIIFIGEEGEVSKFIRNNKLGVHILPNKIEFELPKYLNGEIPFEPNFMDISQYTFSKVTENFLKDINSYASSKD